METIQNGNAKKYSVTCYAFKRLSFSCSLVFDIYLFILVVLFITPDFTTVFTFETNKTGPCQ